MLIKWTIAWGNPRHGLVGLISFCNQYQSVIHYMQLCDLFKDCCKFVLIINLSLDLQAYTYDYLGLGDCDPVYYLIFYNFELTCIE